MPYLANPAPIARSTHSPVWYKTAEHILFVLVILISAWYMAENLKRGWVPHDEGALAQSAERTLHGELPHRDFDEIYTGALSFLNAAAFRMFGPNLASSRYVLFIFAVGWVISMYFAATRLTPFPFAAAITLLAVTWSVPNYSAAMPSWYNLFFATFGVAALLRFIDSGQRPYLFAAGLCGGISFLFKLSGLYYVAGVLLFLVFREQLVNRTAEQLRGKTNLYRVFVVFALLAYLLVLFSVISKDVTLATLLYFFVPAVSVAGAILYREYNAVDRASGEDRFAFLLREVALFTAGVLLPLVVFLIPYALRGGLSSFFNGVFVLPGKRFGYASLAPGLLGVSVGVLLDLLLIAILLRLPSFLVKLSWSLFLVIPMLIVWARISPNIYKAEWSTIWTLLPVSVIAGMFMLARTQPESATTQQQKVFLTLSISAACGLIQFPYAGPIYFIYVAPLVILSIAAVFAWKPPRSSALIAAAYVFCFGFLMFNVTPGFLYEMGRRYSRNKQTAVFTVPRGGNLRILPASEEQYTQLLAIISAHATGNYIYATPDCPEVYFLSGHSNPNRTLFEFLDDPRGHTERVLNSIHNHHINLVVMNQNPYFSGPVAENLRTALNQEFPKVERTVSFEVRWR